LIIYNLFPLYISYPFIYPSPVVPSIPNTDLWINELPGVMMLIISLLAADISIDSIQLASDVAAIGAFIYPVSGFIVRASIRFLLAFLVPSYSIRYLLSLA